MMQEYISRTWLMQNTRMDMKPAELARVIENAPLVEFDTDELTNAKRDLRDCRRELCVLCGEEEKQPLGVCAGCRWRPFAEPPKEET